jgi:hypothetical protein
VVNGLVPQAELERRERALELGRERDRRAPKRHAEVRERGRGVSAGVHVVTVGSGGGGGGKCKFRRYRSSNRRDLSRRRDNWCLGR